MMDSALNGSLLQHYIMKKIVKYPQCISQLQCYEDQYKWNGDWVSNSNPEYRKVI